jgi:hypothetical protein
MFPVRQVGCRHFYIPRISYVIQSPRVVEIDAIYDVNGRQKLPHVVLLISFTIGCLRVCS